MSYIYAPYIPLITMKADICWDGDMFQSFIRNELTRCTTWSPHTITAATTDSKIATHTQRDQLMRWLFEFHTDDRDSMFSNSRFWLTSKSKEYAAYIISRTVGDVEMEEVLDI